MFSYYSHQYQIWYHIKHFALRLIVYIISSWYQFNREVFKRTAKRFVLWTKRSSKGQKGQTPSHKRFERGTEWPFKQPMLSKVDKMNKFWSGTKYNILANIDGLSNNKMGVIFLFSKIRQKGRMNGPLFRFLWWFLFLQPSPAKHLFSKALFPTEVIYVLHYITLQTISHVVRCPHHQSLSS